jgi:hypothetical protein
LIARVPGAITGFLLPQALVCVYTAETKAIVVGPAGGALLERKAAVLGGGTRIAAQIDLGDRAPRIAPYRLSILCG